MSTTTSESSPNPVDRSGSRVALLYFCFFISGIAGLSYEVIWSKYLTLFVGSTGLAQVIVLATFMGGLALGSQLFGKLADRVGSPLKLYAMLEFGVGVYALLFDRIFALGRGAFIALARTDEPQFSVMLGGKVLACVICVLLPTVLMGGTMPAMARHLIRNVKAAGPTISRLYFLNSIGAVAGCLVTGLYLIRALGLQFTMVTGATLNILAGLIAFIATREGREALPAGQAEEAPGVSRPGWVFAILLLCVSVSGAISMMYEVSWIRLLALVLGSSTYAFSLMLATFIFGLSLGGLLLSLKKKPEGYTAVFGLSSVGVGIAVLLALPFYVRLPYIFNQIAASLHREPATFGLYQGCQFVLCAMVMIVPTILQGVTLPAATRALMRDARSVGSRVGLVFAVNTLGTLAGSVFAGCYGLPHLGLKGTLELAVGLNGLLGLLALTAEQPGRQRTTAIAVAALAMAGVWTWYGAGMKNWDQTVLSEGLYRTRQRLGSFEETKKSMERTVLFYRDGMDATVTVFEPSDRKERVLAVNGKPDASESEDLGTQKFLGQIPMITHPHPRRVLVIGIGSGATIGSVLTHDVERVDVVEISRDVVEASRLFNTINGRYWEDPRVHLYVEDAKTFMQVTGRKYDVIISEPSNPWVAGIAGVFSREYFRACQEHLEPGGLFVQWLHTYETEDAAVFMVLETFSGVFPFYTLWNMQGNDMMCMGGNSPYGPDFARMEGRVDQSAVQADLGRMGVHTLLPILALQMWNGAWRPSYVQWTGAIHSDFFPVLEYIAPRGFFIGSSANGVKWIDARIQSPTGSRLWLVDYLKQHKPTRDELRDIHTYITRYSSLIEHSAQTWARAWWTRYPDDAEARAAFSADLGSTFTEALRYVDPDNAANDAQVFQVQKLRCNRLFADYLSQRDYLNPGPAQETLDAINRVIAKFPKEADADLSYWRSQVEYDMGRYADAAASLRGAIAALGPVPDSMKIECAILLCKSLLAEGDAAAAAKAYDDYLKSSEGLHIDILIMRGLIRAGEDAAASPAAPPPASQST